MTKYGQGETGAILKPTFNRKIQQLTGATRTRSRIKGVNAQIWEGITLRRLLRNAGQSELNMSEEEPKERGGTNVPAKDTAFVDLDEKPKSKFESDDD